MQQLKTAGVRVKASGEIEKRSEGGRGGRGRGRWLGGYKTERTGVSPRSRKRIMREEINSRPLPRPHTHAAVTLTQRLLGLRWSEPVRFQKHLKRVMLLPRPHSPFSLFPSLFSCRPRCSSLDSLTPLWLICSCSIRSGGRPAQHAAGRQVLRVGGQGGAAAS